MLKEDITEERLARHKECQEDFTPNEVVQMLYNGIPESDFSDFSKNILDPCCGIGNILIYAIKHRLEFCTTNDDVYNALSTIYGTELIPENAEYARQRMLFTILTITSEKGMNLDESKILEILNKNIVATDSFAWDYKHWKPMPKSRMVELF